MWRLRGESWRTSRDFPFDVAEVREFFTRELELRASRAEDPSLDIRELVKGIGSGLFVGDHLSRETKGKVQEKLRLAGAVMDKDGRWRLPSSFLRPLVGSPSYGGLIPRTPVGRGGIPETPQSSGGMNPAVQPVPGAGSQPSPSAAGAASRSRSRSEERVARRFTPSPVRGSCREARRPGCYCLPGTRHPPGIRCAFCGGGMQPCIRCADPACAECSPYVIAGDAPTHLPLCPRCQEPAEDSEDSGSSEGVGVRQVSE